MSYGAPSYSPQGGVDFGIVSEAFSLLSAHWKVYATAGAVVLLAMAPSQVVGVLPALSDLGVIEWTAWTAGSVTVLGYLLMFLAYVFEALMAAGITFFTLNVIRGLPASPNDIWVGFKDPLGYIWLMIVSGIVGLLGIIACCIGVLVTSGLMMCVYAVKVDREVSATDAVSESWQMLKGEWWMAALFFLVITLISGLGVFACVVGLAFTLPFEFIAAAILYNRYVGWVPQQQPQGASPYPRPGHPGYGTPPQRDIGEDDPPPGAPEERPTPPTD